jgi:predicted amidophosphoribosyltransferase
MTTSIVENCPNCGKENQYAMGSCRNCGTERLIIALRDGRKFNRNEPSVRLWKLLMYPRGYMLCMAIEFGGSAFLIAFYA